MKVIFYSCKEFEIPYLKRCIPDSISVTFRKESLSVDTVYLANGFDAICIFTADDASAEVIDNLRLADIRFIATRAAGYDNIDLVAARNAGIGIANVPEYSPNAIAELAVAMMLALSRKLIIADRQVHQQNFTLDRLIGVDFKNKTIGIIGTGRIGSKVAAILHGFGCKLLAYDIVKNKDLEEKYELEYTSLVNLCKLSDVITIHVPLNSATHYLVNKSLIDQMRTGVLLINTSRGSVVSINDIIDALSTGKIGFLGLDVYEHEKGLFFYDHSTEELKDEVFKKLLSFPNVLITPHQGFATHEALTNIASTTFRNLSFWSNNAHCENEIVHSDFSSSKSHVTVHLM
ncbi:MAG: NAD(P)-dependent oxidoreductase [Flavisolibacter sp.]